MKYELTDERNEAGLYRIRALRDIPRFDVKAGDLGGWVRSEANMAQDGDCWVGGEARVYGSAQVFGSARVSGLAWVSEGARVFGSAQVFGSARVYGSAYVYGWAEVHGSADVYGDARVFAPEHVLSGVGLPSGGWTLFRTEDGHTLHIDCWDGTTAELRTMIAGDDWPEARDEQITQRRPMLAALADMCDAVIATWEGR